MFNLLKEYAYKRADLLRLEATDKGVNLLGALAFIILLLFSLLFFIILFLFGIGFLIGSYINNYGYGLLIVAGFYLIFIFLIFLKRKSIRDFIANKIIETLED